MTTPAAGTNYDIVLTSSTGESQGYMIVPGSYRYERVDDFAPRIATSVAPTLREGIWDAYSQAGAMEGIDQLTLLNANKVYKSDGNVFLSRLEQVMLNSTWNSVAAATAATARMIADGTVSGTDYVVWGVATKVHRVAGTGFSSSAASTTTLGANVVWVHRHGAYFFAACGAGADFYRSSDLDAWTQPASGEKATAFCTWSYNGVTYLVKGYGASFKTSTDDGATWSAAITVGDASTVITGLGQAFGMLVVGKEDGIYSYNGSTTVEELSFPNQRSTGNCKALVYHEGFLYTHILGQVVKLSFSAGGLANMVNITPRMIGDINKEMWNHGLPMWMWSGPFALYVAFDDGESVYPEVLSYNGLGWQQEYRGTSGDNMLMGGYSRLSARTWINDGALRARRHQTLNDLPFADYPTSAVFETSDFDGGLPTMYKAFKSVWVEARNASSARKITTEYSLDRGTTWSTVGDITASGITEFALSGTVGSVASKTMRLRFTLYSSSSTPEIVRWTVNFLTRPDPIYGYAMTVELGPNQVMRDLTTDPIAVDQRLNFLMDAESSLNPLTFNDMAGTAVKAFMTKTTIRRPSEDHVNDEWLVDIVLVEASSASRWDGVYWDSFEWR